MRIANKPTDVSSSVIKNRAIVQQTKRSKGKIVLPVRGDCNSSSIFQESKIWFQFLHTYELIVS